MGVGLGALKVKMALAWRLMGGPMLGQDVPAVTFTSTLCPASPRAVKLPVKLPARSIVALPPTPVPLTLAAPVGAAPEPHNQPAPLRLPDTVGGLPEDGLSATAGAAAALYAGPTTWSTREEMTARTIIALCIPHHLNAIVRASCFGASQCARCLDD